MMMQWHTNFDYWTGVVALLAQAWLTFASISPLRNMSYEWFKFSHFVAALVFMLFLFFHCSYTLSSWDYFIVTGVFFSLSWLHRQLRILFEHGVHSATISLAPNGFVCVHVPTQAVWEVGQHFFVRFMTMGVHALSIHPFTACSLPSQSGPDSELVFYIRPRGGLTPRLAQLAASRPGSQVRVLLDGPYGGVSTRKVQQCRRQLVIAGGSGAGWILPMLIACLRSNNIIETDMPEKVDTIGPSTTMRIVLATRDIATRQWFQKAVHEVLSEHGLDRLPPSVELETHYTGQAVSEPSIEPTRAASEPEAALDKMEVTTRLDSDSDASSGELGRLKRSDGRPGLGALVRAEIAAASAERLGVFVCGPLSMQNDVSNAVAQAQLEILKGASKDVYLHMEHFSWA
ncbi:hypothetical protein LTR53_011862 [Teratosphaeriaceae sp. CCFEE 6253]|nr:hypothetical protein LTR53_011862 [Teratosphaeriaceae sp. CCFEE 6253]